MAVLYMVTVKNLVRYAACQAMACHCWPLAGRCAIKVISDIVLIKNIHIRYCAVASCDSRQKTANVPSAGTGTL